MGVSASYIGRKTHSQAQRFNRRYEKKEHHSMQRLKTSDGHNVKEREKLGQDIKLFGKITFSNAMCVTLE